LALLNSAATALVLNSLFFRKTIFCIKTPSICENEVLFIISRPWRKTLFLFLTSTLQNIRAAIVTFTQTRIDFLVNHPHLLIALLDEPLTQFIIDNMDVLFHD